MRPCRPSLLQEPCQASAWAEGSFLHGQGQSSALPAAGPATGLLRHADRETVSSRASQVLYLLPSFVLQPGTHWRPLCIQNSPPEPGEQALVPNLMVLQPSCSTGQAGVGVRTDLGPRPSPRRWALVCRSCPVLALQESTLSCSLSRAGGSRERDSQARPRLAYL